MGRYGRILGIEEGKEGRKGIMGNLDSQAGYELTRHEKEVASLIVGCAYRVHRNTGAGLLESVYEACFCYELEREGLRLARQKPVPLVYAHLVFEESFRIDVLVENLIICELKSVNDFLPVHRAQLTTYLKLTDKNVGFLINFNTDLMKNGLRRLVNPSSLPSFPSSIP